jgi:hypothetical protein
MLMEPTHEIDVGSEVSLILKDKTGKTFEFMVPVETR